VTEVRGEPANEGNSVQGRKEGKMNKLDEEILRCYVRLQEYQEQRQRFQRLLHPEEIKWENSPPKMTRTKQIRVEELKCIGFDEVFYRRMKEGEEREKANLEALVESHPLAEYAMPITGWGLLTLGKYIAASGDITIPPTVSSYWYGMGLDIVNGKAPRRIRRKKVARRIPALPHVTKIGEQIRQQMLKQNSFFRELYYDHKADYLERYPKAPKMFAHKHGQRIAQKILYACLFRKWRELYGLPAPLPYPYAILRHNGRMITLEDFYGKPDKKGSRKAGRARGEG
jgi:hypothetical protein